MQIQTNYNPDVLSCLANLSNDEVFTPPRLANQMLDLLPNDLWNDPEVRFLDPVCKSGVFLREVTKRLMIGLENLIPDKQDRINHIFKNQLFGLAITELTSLLSRRSIYCSKFANSFYSVCEDFTDEKGNILYDRIDHTWRNRNCIYCGASQGEYNRGEDLETHAYQFIHNETPENIFNMKFDVIIGNPPYQLNDGGGTGSSAKPIYHRFIEQAKRLQPKYLSMIIPARWYSGGKGLDEFRFEMLKDKRIRRLIDFPDSRDCFPGVDIAGGICYFLWERDNPGSCDVEVVRKNEKTISTRNLDEFENFVRDNIALDIVHKVKKKSVKFLDEIVSSRMPFGLPSNTKPEKSGDLLLIASGGNGRISRDKIRSGTELIDKWKVLLSKASNDHGGQPDKDGKRRIFSRVEVMPPNTVCTESYLVVGAYGSQQEAVNMCTFLKTRFCRYLVSTVLLTQNITKGKFVFVPNLEMDMIWNDSLLYEKFSLSSKEVESIESLIRPMN